MSSFKALRLNITEKQGLCIDGYFQKSAINSVKLNKTKSGMCTKQADNREIYLVTFSLDYKTSVKAYMICMHVYG